MAAKKLESYKTGNHNFPEDNINPEIKKNKEWFICLGAAMLNDYTNNRCEVPYSVGENQASVKTLRAYAQGRQGAASIKKQLLRNKDFKNNLFKTKMRINWDTYDVLPEKLDVIRAINQKQDYEINVSCSDFESLDLRDQQREMLKFLLEEENQKMLEITRFKPQTEIDPQQMGFKNAADVDRFFDTGNFVMMHELKAIAACNKTKMISGYKSIENRCTDDLIALGIAGVRNYIDEATLEVKQRYSNIANVIMPSFSGFDSRDNTWTGELREITIAQAAEIDPTLSASDLCKLAQDYAYLACNNQYADMLSNLLPENIGYGTNANFTGENNFLNRVKILVLDFQVLSVDHETYFKDKDRKDNSEVFKPVKFGYDLDNREKKRGAIIKRSKVIRKHEAIWVVGTDVLLKFGAAKNSIYYGPDGNRTPRLDWFFAKTCNKSLVERCMTHVDDINMAVIKLRNAIAMLPPAPRMIIRQGALDNVFIGDVKQEPDELIQTLIERGYLIISDTDEHGNPIFQNGKAVDFLQTNIAEDVNIFTNVRQQGINGIAQVLGLPEGLDGTSGNPYQGVGKMELAADASSNALFPTLGRLNDIFDPAFEDVIKKWQSVSTIKNIKVAYKPLGTTSNKVFELSGLFSTADFNIKLRVGPNDSEKARILQDLQGLKGAYESSQGTVGISAAEYLMLYDLIMAGNIKLAMYKMAQIQEERVLQAQAKAQRDQQWNIESQTASSKTAESERRMTLSLESTLKGKELLITGAQARKTAIVSALVKAMGETPDQNYVDQLLAEANGEISAAMQQLPSDEQQAPEQGQQAAGGAEMQPQMEEQPDMLSQTA